MSDFQQYITDGQNNVAIKCPFCNSSILPSYAAAIHKYNYSLPLISQTKDKSDVETEEIDDWWLVEDMMTFDNIGFTNTVGSTKYLSCADCERGPLGYHDILSKKSYVALSRVKHVT